MKRLLTKKSLAILFLLISVAFLLPGSSTLITAASFPSFPPTKTDYCYVPPFVTRSLPPAVMLIVQRDEKLYQPAYNDYTDLDGDGDLETTYKHSIDYYGYFDSYKCYEYSGSGVTAKFVPFSVTSNKYCEGGATGKWSGNFLNWASMTRMDVMRKVLYGGYRSTDANASGATLERAFLPQSSHSFAKVYTGADKNKLTPYSDPSLTFCNTTIGGNSNPPSLRVAKGDESGLLGWPNWATVERWECAYESEHNSGTGSATSLRRPSGGQKVADLNVRVDVAVPALLGKEKVKQYPSGNYKPIGLLQKYGEGTDKVCSKTLGKACSTDTDCSVSTEGKCMVKSQMYFGLITGSFGKNKSGGVLRSKVADISNTLSNPDADIDPATGVFTGGAIIGTINKLKIIRYDWTQGYFNTAAPTGDNCPWGQPSFSDGSCSNWGNPLAEMFYEALRYFAGKTSATSAYNTNDNSYINNLKTATWDLSVDPFTYMPYCSKPYILILNDVTPSYDSDQLPGAYWGSFGAADFSGEDSSGASVTLNVSTETKAIGDKENYTGHNYFIGQSGATVDSQCTAKTVSDLSSVRGLCPGGPGTQGSYYLAGLAWYAKRLDLRPSLGGSGSRQNVTTFVVALDSGLPEIKVGPFTVQPACFNNDSGMKKPCRLVTFRQVAKTATTGTFYYSWEDTMQGGDTDEDADGTISYVYDSGANTLTMTTRVLYSSTPNDLQIGYSISGSTDDGLYLEASNGRQMTFSYPTCTNFGFNCTAHNGSTITPCSSCRLNVVHNAGSTAATYMKNPLWLAAKYGGFRDGKLANGTVVTEPEPTGYNFWDQINNDTGAMGSDGIPDTYFEAKNPGELEGQLERALMGITSQMQAGTTVASMPPTGSTESSTVAQAYFFQQKYDGNQLLKWVGYMRLLWSDTAGSIHENTDTSGESSVLKFFDLINDKIVAFVYNYSSQRTDAYVYADSTDNISTPQNEAGDMIPDSCAYTTVDAADVAAAVDAGAILKATSPDARRIFFWFDSSNSGTVDLGEFVTMVKDDNFQATHFSSMWSYGSTDACDAACAKAVMKYIMGYDRPNNTNFTLRQAVTTGTDLTNTWKLGDIIYSSPRIWANRAANNWTIRYGDATYRAFIENTISTKTPLVLAGANDGLVHAFRAGKYSLIDPPTTPKTVGRLDASAVAPSGLTNLGDEVWTYLPRNAAPYLRWYCNREDCHIPLVDSTMQIIDASIGGAATGTKDATTWKRLLVGTMGFGGSAIQVGTATPVTYSSSIFVLDVTDALNPVLLWEKTLPDNTLATSTPALVRLGASSLNGDWYLVVGSGPQRVTTTSLTYTNTPKIFVFDLRDGTEKTSGGLTIDAAVTGAAVGNILSVDLDNGSSDYQTDDLYFGTYGGSTVSPKGNLYRMRIRSGSSYITNPASWVIEKMIALNDRVFAEPAATFDESNSPWLYFGTGLFVTQDDVPVTTGYLYGVREKTACWTGSGACSTYSNFLDTSAIVFSQAVATTVSCQCPGGVFFSSISCSPPGTCATCSDGTAVVSAASGGVLSGLSACTSPPKSEKAGIACVENQLSTMDGWKWRNTTQDGKYYSTPTVFGGLVAALYFVPDTDVCTYGNTWLAAVNYTTGTPYFVPTILDSASTSGTYASLTIGSTVKVSGGAPAPGGGTVIGNKLIGKDGTGQNLVQTSPPWNRFIQWITR